MEVNKKEFTFLERLHLEFGNVAWSQTLRTNRNFIEGVQQQATRMVPELKELEYEERLERMESTSLRYRRARGDMIDTYKYTHAKHTFSKGLLVRNKDSVMRELPETTKRYCKGVTRFKFYSFRIVLMEFFTRGYHESFKARLDNCWSGRKFISKKLDAKQLISQNKDYLDNNEGNGNILTERH